MVFFLPKHHYIHHLNRAFVFFFAPVMGSEEIISTEAFVSKHSERLQQAAFSSSCPDIHSTLLTFKIDFAFAFCRSVSLTSFKVLGRNINSIGFTFVTSIVSLSKPTKLADMSWGKDWAVLIKKKPFLSATEPFWFVTQKTCAPGKGIDFLLCRAQKHSH